MPRCKSCKEKFEPKEFLQKFCKGSIDCLTAEGLYKLDKHKKQEVKDWKKKVKDFKQSDPKHKSNPRNMLKEEVQKLARLIDVRFGFNCCCCNKIIEGSGHGAHYHNKGGNENIMYNLHIIHRSRAYCNMYNSEHKKDYPVEMKRRYGKEYADYLEIDIRIIYKEMHFSITEINQALKMTRYIIRNLDTFNLIDSINARDDFNLLIGLYKEKVRQLKR